MKDFRSSDSRVDAAPHLIVELTNICNLHCSYCVRDEEALHQAKAQYFPIELLQRITRRAREVFGIEEVVFTGGEATLHPQFRECIEAIAAQDMTVFFITNGWHFDRVYPALLANRKTIRRVGFSLDGATKEAHDQWRGQGSFVRLMRAVAKCFMQDIPFVFKVVLRRDTVGQLEQIALMAARLGAAGLNFAHLLPTSEDANNELLLDLKEQQMAEQELNALSRILKMPISMAAGFYDTDPAPPCSALLAANCNVDYKGNMTLCCNLSGFRGADGNRDVIADLTKEDFATAFARLRAVAEAQVARRAEALAAAALSNQAADLYTGSPCLFCLQSFGKIPWRTETTSITNTERSLPILAGV